jgi:aminoglycoside phosphotransferase (APT) family kinase protein
MQEMIPKISAYLRTGDWDRVSAMRDRTFEVLPLAQGEYNLNFMLRSGAQRLVFRVNIGSQIGRDDQILYEFKALQILRHSGVTPRPHFVDDSRSFFDRGILIMDYLAGEPLDYTRDLEAAARLFARLHQTPVPASENHLIREERPLSLIFDECARLLQRYFESPLADPEIGGYLEKLKSWADEARASESYFQSDPWPCVINTEVNSGNFIVNRGEGGIHLVDWEMPRWGDPSQDLCHFCSPLTTLWKSEYRMSAADKRRFLKSYTGGIRDRHLRRTLTERLRLRDPFVHLRGISWAAMGWIAYQTDFAGLRNPDTWRKLQQYMNLDFIRSLFDPMISNRHRSNSSPRSGRVRNPEAS